LPDTQIAANLHEQIWGGTFWRAVVHMMGWTKYIGTGENNMVVVQNEFKKEAGDKMTIPLSYPLEGEGIDGDALLEDNEEVMDTYDFSFYVDQKRNAVRLKGRMDAKRTRLKLRREASDRLAMWMSEIVDKELTRKAAGVTTATFANTPTTPTTLLAGGDAASGGADLATGDWIGTAEIDRMKYTAQTRYPKIMPLTVEGGKWYVLQIHPDQTYKLRNDSNWKNAQQYAMPRGSDNPLFTTALGTWNGVIIHENEAIPRLTLNSLEARRALFMGRQAMVMGYGGAVGWYEKDFDYGNKQGFAITRIFGCQAPLFNSLDVGRLAMDSYAPVPTGVAHS
jgi:N4-gp56 family major capsid protein